MASKKKQIPVDVVVKKFVEIRDELTEKRKEFKEYEMDAKQKMDRLSMWFKERADEQGVEALPTKYGTAYKTTKDYVRVGDWDEVLKFIKENEFWQMLEKRLGKIATKEIMEENNGEIPPGVEYSQEIVFQVRKPTK